jgi:hypothetical protein
VPWLIEDLWFDLQPGQEFLCFANYLDQQCGPPRLLFNGYQELLVWEQSTRGMKQTTFLSCKGWEYLELNLHCFIWLYGTGSTFSFSDSCTLLEQPHTAIFWRSFNKMTLNAVTYQQWHWFQFNSTLTQNIFLLSKTALNSVPSFGMCCYRPHFVCVPFKYLYCLLRKSVHISIYLFRTAPVLN